MSNRLSRPTVFVGSSTKALPIAEEVERCLEDIAVVQVWNTAFDPGRVILDVILQYASQSDFGIFVVAADDAATFKGKKLSTVRDNVLFEAGVFMGALGPARTFLLWPRVPPDRLRVPSDLLGLVPITYGRRRAARWNLTKELGRARSVISAKGPALRTGYNEIESLKSALNEREIELSAGRPESVLEIIARGAGQRRREWFSATSVDILMQSIGKRYSDAIVNEVFWWLIVHGVVSFNNIEIWSDSEGDWKWKDSKEYVEFTSRGVALLNDLRSRRR